MSGEATSALGFRIHSDSTETVQWQGHAMRVIGELHRADEFIVGERADDGSAWVLTADLANAWPLNAHRPAFEACLAAFDRYIETGPPDLGPMVLTAAEVRERRERRARGELAPRSRRGWRCPTVSDCRDSAAISRPPTPRR